jgi:hypothetical protein
MARMPTARRRTDQPQKPTDQSNRQEPASAPGKECTVSVQALAAFKDVAILCVRGADDAIQKIQTDCHPALWGNGDLTVEFRMGAAIRNIVRTALGCRDRAATFEELACSQPATLSALREARRTKLSPVVLASNRFETACEAAKHYADLLWESVRSAGATALARAPVMPKPVLVFRMPHSPAKKTHKSADTLTHAKELFSAACQFAGGGDRLVAEIERESSLAIRLADNSQAQPPYPFATNPCANEHNPAAAPDIDGMRQGAHARTKTPRVKASARNDIIIGMLTEHHKYKAAGALNYEPMLVTEIATRAGDAKSGTPLSRSGISRFFKKFFNGHDGYVRCCRNKSIGTRLQQLNRELPDWSACDPTRLDGEPDANERNEE